MAFSVTIPIPVLPAGAYFKVRYRQLPSGTWQVLSPNPTNAPFSLPISFGNYEMEVRAVINGTECPPIIYPITPKGCDCPTTLTAQLVRLTATQTVLQVSYNTIPSGGFIVEYLNYGSGNIQRANYPAPAPAPGSFSFPVTGSDYDVRVYANCNVGEPVLCLRQRVTLPVAPGPCKKWSDSSGTITLQRLSNGQYRLRVVRELPPSATAPTQCEQIQLSYHQYDNYTPNLQGNNGAITLSNGDFQFQTTVPNDTAYVGLNPVMNTVQTSYNVSLIDCCGAQFAPNPGKFNTKTGQPV